jgi:protein-disulfide isomerase
LDVNQLSAALQHAPYRLLLKRDIHEGLKLGIVGTPSYLIDGRIYEGSIPAEVLKPILKVAASE